MISIHPSDPRHPEIVTLLEQSHALMNSLYSTEACHILSIDDLCGDHVLFYGAMSSAQYVGCAALVLKGQYGEIKSMFVDPTERGRGVAKRLMSTLEERAHAHELDSLKLETGHLLKEAVKLYKGFGFTACAAFGDYPDHPDSLFMSKKLDRSAAD